MDCAQTDNRFDRNVYLWYFHWSGHFGRLDRNAPWNDRWTDEQSLNGQMDRLNRWTTRQTEWMYSMDGWTDGQMDGRWYQQTDWTHSYITWWTDRQMDRDRSNRQTDEQIDRHKYTGRQHGWMNWMNGLTGQMEGQMKWIDRCINGLNGWTNELNSWTDGQTNGRTEQMEWLNGRMDDRLNKWINGRIKIIE